MGLIIDTPTNVQNMVHALARANVEAVIRYECRPPGGGWKRWQPDEIHALADAGIQVGIVYESAGNHAGYFSESMGYQDASYARGRAAARGQSDDSGLYFAVDYDASLSDLNNRIGPYFLGVRRAFQGPGPRLRVGCYGSGYVTNQLKAKGLIDLRWVTCSLGFRGSRDAVRNHEYELWQTRCDTRLLGTDVDFDVANVKDWGQYVPWNKEPTPEPAPPQPGKIYQTGIASWYNDGENASGKPVNNSTDLTAAHRSLPFGTEVKVTRKSTGKSTTVVIEDRGPAARTGRIIDLRPKPARELDMIDDGIADVTLEII